MDVENKGHLRFGNFEFRPATGELQRDGAPVRLQAQPAQVLGLLLRNPGKVITRTELKDAIWGTGTFVDFDRGLNFCIAQLRAALGDSAEASVYIRTLPKRGYQFIAPVSGPAEGSSAADRSVALRPAPSRLKGPWVLTLAMLSVAVGLVLLGRFFGPLRQPKASSVPAIRVAVARFDNETGNNELDRFADALSDSVTAKLTASSTGRYGVIGNAAILRVPRDQRDLLAIGSSLHADYVVLAQVRNDSLHCFVLAHLIHLPDQTHVAVTDLNCSASDSLQVPSNLADRIADKFSPLIAR